MRDIKFRVWVKTAEVKDGKVRSPFMGKVLVLDTLMEEVAVALTETTETKDYSTTTEGHYAEFSFEDVELMQYTGLKDKNGTEIYEGDVVLWFGVKAQIHWADGHAGFFHGSDDLYKRYAEQAEIIGNIYENKELIK